MISLGAIAGGPQKEAADMQECLEKDEVTLLFYESQIKLREVEEDLLQLVDGESEISPERISLLFRAFHGVKCAAEYLQHHPLQRLSRASEAFLGAVRDGTADWSSAHAAVLLSAVDRMKEMVADTPGRREVEFTSEIENLDAMQPPQGVPDALPDAPRRLKVLVAEDEFASRMMLQGLLSKYGDCHVAVNGREAVAAFHAARQSGQDYDLICMDICMPELNGTAAVQQIRDAEEAANIMSTSGVKIFMTTEIRDIKAVTASFKALCDAYLFKPVDGERLEDHLRSFGLIGRRWA